MNKKVSAKSILGLIDDNLLDSLADETDVDFNVKKLLGKVIFKLLLMTILDDSKASLRIMEKIYSSNKFKKLFYKILLMDTKLFLFNVFSKNTEHASLSIRCQR